MGNKSDNIWFIIVLVSVLSLIAFLEWHTSMNTNQVTYSTKVLNEIEERDDWVLKNTGKGLITYYDYKTDAERIRQMVIILFVGIGLFLFGNYMDKKGYGRLHNNSE